MLKLFGLTGDDQWRMRAHHTILAFGDRLERQPDPYPYLLAALADLVAPARQIVIAGDPDSSETQALIQTVNAHYLPGTVIALATPDAEQVLPIVKGRVSADGEAAAYVCEEFSCKLPVHNSEALEALL
jgi:uncharacterized protein YyaL (SSP411 family)